MTYETVEQTVNLLCEKLGIVVDSATGVAEQLVPQLAKLEIASNGFDAVFTTIILTLAIKWILKIVHYMKSEDYDFDDDFLCLLGISALGLAAVVSFFIFGEVACQVLEWVVAPDIKAIEYITSLIG